MAATLLGPSTGIRAGSVHLKPVSVCSKRKPSTAAMDPRALPLTADASMTHCCTPGTDVVADWAAPGAMLA